MRSLGKSYWRVFSFMAAILFATINSVNALPNHPYGPWRLNCMDTLQRYLVHPGGSRWSISSTESWSAELQNNKELEESSVRCWCESDIQHEWDTEELGAGNGWWSMIQHLTREGQKCTCPSGRPIMVEMDNNTCDGTEVAHGFFHCSGSGCPGSITSSGAKASSPSKIGSLWQALGIAGIAALL